MKFIYTAILTGAITMIAGAANANMLFDIYAGGFAGYGGNITLTKLETDDLQSMSYGGFVGISLPIVRLEAEYDYFTMSDNPIQLGMVNVYAGMPSVFIKPYLGAGVGLLFAGNIEGVNADSDMAYQGMFGLSFSIPKIPIVADAELRAIYTSVDYSPSRTTTHSVNYEGRIKLRYTF